jgi:OOP family OmpA-OmpF porin
MKRLSVATVFAAGWFLFGVTCVGAVDLTDKLQLSGIAQAAWPLGQRSVLNQTGNVGDGLGALIAYGISSHWSLGLSYDNIDLARGFRMQPAMFNGIYRLYTDKKWTPNFQLGAGMVKGVTDSSYNHVSAKAGVGLEYFVCSGFSLGPQVTYVLADDQTQDKQFAHVITAGLMANMFFGGSAPAPAPVVTQAVAPPPPPPPPPPVAIALNPASAVLSEGQTQMLNASVSGTANQSVTWSLAPQLGMISDQGLYTAPATVAIRQDVVVTAKSAADPSKSASSTITLQPAKPVEKVSLTIDVLFDTAKAVVKPAYDAEIKKVADFMNTYTGAKAEIEGHTDSAGNAAYNQTLSQQRADAVRQYLIDKYHIDAARLTAKGYGPTQPIADNKTKEGRAKNRRVVATLTATKS